MTNAGDLSKPLSGIDITLVSSVSPDFIFRAV
jgi:hypothetical protein